MLNNSAATQTEADETKAPESKEQTEQREIIGPTEATKPAGPTRYRVAPGDNLCKIATRHQVEWTVLAQANALTDYNLIRVGQVLIIPRSDRPGDGTAAPAKPNRYPWPVTGSITKHYGGRHDAFHHGLDIAAPTGTPIAALDGGVVIWADWKTIYGLCVIIDHGQGRKSLYGHASKLLVQKGNTVSAGQIIAQIGSTGRSTGPHLHLEIYDNGQTVNPLAFLE